MKKPILIVIVLAIALANPADAFGRPKRLLKGGEQAVGETGEEEMGEEAMEGGEGSESDGGKGGEGELRGESEPEMSPEPVPVGRPGKQKPGNGGGNRNNNQSHDRKYIHDGGGTRQGNGGPKNGNARKGKRHSGQNNFQRNRSGGRSFGQKNSGGRSTLRGGKPMTTNVRSRRMGAEPECPSSRNECCPKTTPSQNKAFILKFFDDIFNHHRFSLIENYLAENKIEHNPYVLDGRENMKKNIIQALENTPKRSLRIMRVISDEDFVWIHSALPIHGKDTIFLDIYRIECGKVAEHWDSIQQVDKNAPNPKAYY